MGGCKEAAGEGRLSLAVTLSPWDRAVKCQPARGQVLPLRGKVSGIDQEEFGMEVTNKSSCR